MSDYTEADIYGHGDDLWPAHSKATPLVPEVPVSAGDNGVTGPLYATIRAQGQRDALKAVRHAIDDVEIVKGVRVPRALKDAVRELLDRLPAEA